MSFRFKYEPGTIHYGAGCVETIEEELATRGIHNAMLVTGRTVGSTRAVVDPVREGAGDRIAKTFAETTPDKRLSTAFDGAARIRNGSVDGLLALGSGSSLDLAKIMAIVAASDRSTDEIRTEFEQRQTISMPESELPPIAVVPTTLAGADLSMVAGITSRRSGLVRGGVADPRLMPEAMWYDPDLFRRTPAEILCASAMNGFDKAIETPYAAARTPISDATARRALEFLSEGLPRLGEGRRDDKTMHDVVVGTMLAQYGCSRADGSTLSIIHAFGHGIARGYAIQQGGAHGIIAPHALAYLFERIDGRRHLLAEGLVVDDYEDPAAAVVEAVAGVRDSLGLPAQLRAIEDMSEGDLPEIARDVESDPTLGGLPDTIDPTADELEAVLREAW